MCGIAGILDVSGQTHRPALQAMASALAHRGPDGEGLWFSDDGTAGLAHRRLAILDTSERGHQPMHTADGAFSIVFNGEIFNFLELRTELQAKGHVFRTDTDTEVILAAWRQWGEDMLPRFNGMWAIALRDNRSGHVFFSRDRFGIKPLHYAVSGTRLAFASEMQAFARLPWLPRDIDLSVARRLLFDPFSVEGGRHTLLVGVSRLPAGHCAWWKDGVLTVNRWWRTTEHLTDTPRDPQERVERFRELFLDAIRLRMRSDVTIGTCLSGGFDSSAIVCAMSEVAAGTQPSLRAASDWRHAFIASFPGRSIDETPLALEAAQWAGVKAHAVDLGEVSGEDRFDQVLRALDEVYISLPEAPWQIYRTLRQHGTLVSLDGHGADELMGGYRQSGQGFGFALRNHLTSLALGSRGVGNALEAAKLAWMRRKGMAFVRGEGFRAPTNLQLPADADELPAHWGPLNKRLYRMFHSTVLPTILRNFDRLSMAHGIEVRMPFMDWRLVTYVMSLPDEAKVDRALTKAVARHAMKGRMPESIRSNARKIGFNSPMPEWMNGALGQWSRRQVQQATPEFKELVDHTTLLRRLAELNEARAWSWESVGRLWPYIHMSWTLRQIGPRT